MSATSANLSSVEIAVRTDPGRDPDKQVNEDAWVFKETAQGILAVVCDGMGGHAGGKEASDLATRTVVEVVEAAPAATPPGVALKHAIEEANARVWSMPTAEAGYRPGSTIVAALFHARGCEIAHVGDSRIYLVHAGAVSQVTRDHSIVQEMVDRNLIRAEDAAKHPDANKILRALGIAKDVDVELRAEPIGYVSGDLLVLCSDGLSDLVDPAEILEIAGTHPPAQAAHQLIDLANARGGHDNITAMVVRAKTNAALHSQSPVKKTVPLTAIPADRGSGPTGTVVGPAHTVMTAPAPNAISAPPAQHAFSGPPSHRASVPPPRRTGLIALAVVLGVVAIGIVGTVAYLDSQGNKHKSVPIVEDQREAGPGAAIEETDGGQEIPAVVPAPPLVAPTASTPKWAPKDGGTPDPCGALQRARARDAGADLIQKLTEKCAASGGAVPL